MLWERQNETIDKPKHEKKLLWTTSPSTPKILYARIDSGRHSYEQAYKVYIKCKNQLKIKKIPLQHV